MGQNLYRGGRLQRMEVDGEEPPEAVRGYPNERAGPLIATAIVPGYQS